MLGLFVSAFSKYVNFEFFLLIFSTASKILGLYAKPSKIFLLSHVDRNDYSFFGSFLKKRLSTRTDFGEDDLSKIKAPPSLHRE